MKLSYSDVGDGQRHEATATVTTAHSASSYGQPVIVLEDGGALDAASWALLNYQIVEVSGDELALLQRSPFFTWPGAPGAGALASPGPGRPKTVRTRKRVMVTLYAAEIEALRTIGEGSVSQGISVLLRERQP